MVDQVLKSSLQDRRIITIMYQSENGVTQRDIKIIKLTEENIEAYCYLRHQVRHFRKENILAALYKN